MGDVGILPSLGQQAVVPVDVVGVEAQLALLDVLLDGVALLVLPAAVLEMQNCIHTSSLTPMPECCIELVMHEACTPGCLCWLAARLTLLTNQISLSC